MQLASNCRARPLLRGGGDQRVRGSHTISVDDQDAGLDCLLDHGRIPDRRELGNGQIGAEGDREHQPADLRRKPADAGTEHVFDRVGHGEVLADARQVALGQRPADLEREERVAEGRVDEAAHQTAREAEAEAVEQELARRAEAQRSHVEAFELRWSNGPLERRHSTGALGQQEADRSATRVGGPQT